jgi:hypothetical protein
MRPISRERKLFNKKDKTSPRRHCHQTLACMETTTATPPPRELNEDDLAFLERYSAFRRSQRAGGGHHEEREEPSQEHERARLRQHIRYLWTTCLAEVHAHHITNTRIYYPFIIFNIPFIP